MEKAEAICEALKALLKGEVFCDEVHRTVYSSAACMYEIKPMAVVFPRDKDDVSLILRYCYDHSIPVTARGGGSGLAGQAIGSGIILDFSVHMNRILGVNESERTVNVQPGVVLSNLNGVLGHSNLFFPPDPSSGDYCTIGGMIANNSSGSHSLKYGATKDYVVSLEVILSDGEKAVLGQIALDSPELQDLRKKDTHEGAIYTSMIGLLWRNRKVIDEYSPRVEKNSSGYNLKEAFTGGAVDLSRVIVGSEGTLAIVTEATLRLLEVPQHACSLVLVFDDLEKTGKAVLEARKYEPSAVEIMDEGVLKAARGIGGTVEALVPEGSKAVLLIEFDGEDRREMEKKARALESRAVNTTGVFAGDSKQIEDLWQIRKAAVPIVMKTKERSRPVAFVEDIVVPPDSLPRFLERLHTILERHSVDAPAYGHAGEGNIHVRPVLDLSCQEGIEKMEAIARDIYALTKEVGGSLSGEHGDGLVRAPFLKEFTGPLYELFFWTKRIFDPKGILNPGKKIGEDTSISRNLRFGASYRNVFTGTGFDARRVTEQIERCHGCGMCRSVVNTTMCPVYRAFGDEKYSPRGKANLLRSMISGSLGSDELIADKDFRELVEMCYGCRMCLSECPTEVNVPLLVMIAKAEIARRYGIPLSDKMFCNFETIGRLGSLIAPLANLMMRVRPVRGAIQRFSGFSRARILPAFNRGRFNPRRKSLLVHGKSRVVYFPGCFVNSLDANLGQSLVSLLEDADMEVIIPDLLCCGIPSMSHGDMDGAKRRAEKNVSVLEEFAANCRVG